MRLFSRQRHTSATRLLLVTAASAALLAAAGCHRQNVGGQTIATVDGDPITSSELKIEMANVPAALREQAKGEVLQAMIDRRLLAKAAEQAKLDKNPTFILQLRRAQEVMLAQQKLQQMSRAARQPVSETEVNAYLDRHPNIGAERKILSVDQVQFPTPSQAVQAALGRTQTLDQVVAVLQQNNIKFQRGRGQIDTASLPDAALAQMKKLRPGEPIISINQPVSVANAVVGEQAAPLSEGDQNKVARQRIEAERGEASVKQGTDALRQSATITYADGYQPKPKPKS